MTNDHPIGGLLIGPISALENVNMYRTCTPQILALVPPTTSFPTNWPITNQCTPQIENVTFMEKTSCKVELDGDLSQIIETNYNTEIGRANAEQTSIKHKELHSSQPKNSQPIRTTPSKQNTFDTSIFLENKLLAESHLKQQPTQVFDTSIC